MAFSEKTYEPVAAKAMTKQAANWGPAFKAVGKLLGGGGSATAMDRVINGDWIWNADDIDAGRAMNFAINTGLGFGSTHYMAKGKPLESVALFTSMPAKDLMLTSLPAARKLPEAIDTYVNASQKGNQGNNGVGTDTKPGVTVNTGNDWATATAIGIGALGLAGLGGWGLYEWLKARQEDKARDSRMKMRIKTPNGDDAVVDVPLVNPNMSPQLEEDFNRGVTRGVRQIARHNSFKRDPQTGKLMKYQDWYNQYGKLEEEGNTSAGDMGKAANVVNMPRLNLLEGTVPPAQEGTNQPVRTGFVRSYLDSLTKRASRERKTNEATGGVTAPLLTAALAGLAAKAMGAGNGTALGAAGVAGVAAPLVGTALAATRPVRAQAEQDRIDAEGSGWENWLVPGLAQYNQVQRARVLPNTLAVATRAAVGDEIPDIDGDGEPDVVPERMTITRDSLSPMKLDDDF